MNEPRTTDPKTDRHIRALVIMQGDALSGRPWRSLKEIKRALKNGEIPTAAHAEPCATGMRDAPPEREGPEARHPA